MKKKFKKRLSEWINFGSKKKKIEKWKLKEEENWKMKNGTTCTMINDEKWRKM